MPIGKPSRSKWRRAVVDTKRLRFALVASSSACLTGQQAPLISTQYSRTSSGCWSASRDRTSSGVSSNDSPSMMKRMIIRSACWRDFVVMNLTAPRWRRANAAAYAPLEPATSITVDHPSPVRAELPTIAGDRHSLPSLRVRRPVGLRTRGIPCYRPQSCRPPSLPPGAPVPGHRRDSRRSAASPRGQAGSGG